MPAFEEFLFAIALFLLFAGVALPPFIGKPFFWFLQKPKKSSADELLEAKAHRDEAERHTTAAYIEAEAKRLEREAEDVEFGARLKSKPESIDPSKPSKPYTNKKHV